jgi:glycosyltransferase involved in cell wall biosynthesis
MVPCVSVYAITFNQCDRLEQTLASLFDQDYPAERYQIIVLDDGSADGTSRLLADLAATGPATGPVELIGLRCEREGDYLSARRWNQCIAACSPRTDVLIQIDDVLVRPDFIRQHVKWHEGGGDFLVTGAKFEGDEETWDLASCRRGKLAGDGGAAATVEAFTAVWGASLSFSRRAVEKIYQEPHEIPYDQRMRGWGYHEVELACRMQAAGAKIVYDPAAGVFHQNHTAESEAGRGLDRQALVRDGMLENEAYLLRKHGLPSLPRW